MVCACLGARDAGMYVCVRACVWTCVHVCERLWVLFPIDCILNMCAS